jgi:uncharacterized membrane protein YagU involved in acid resistance
MRAPEPPWQAALTGAVAGLAGGLAFGAAILKLGVPTAMGLLLAGGSPTVGFVVHMLIAAVLGVGFGLLARWQRPGPGDTVSLGIAYAALWWYAGPLTLMPLLLGVSPAWDLKVAQQQFPGLLGHLLYGACTGLALAIVRYKRPAERARPAVANLVCGVLAGLVAAWLIPMPLALAPLVGLGYALLYPRADGGVGLGLVRGQAYGFLWWVVGGLTVLPLLNGGDLEWSVDQARSAFATFPQFLLFGVAVGVMHGRLCALARLLFSNQAPSYTRANPGAGRLAAVTRDVAAGSVGGLAFTLVLSQTGFLRTVAGLVGSARPLTGFVLHLAISIGVGVSFGQLFRAERDSLGSALGWGLSYGFFWWVLGSLTLLPMLLGGAPQWSVGAAASGFAALIGHLAYGLALGLTFHVLERRHRAGLRPAPAGDGRPGLPGVQLQEAAPALLALMVVMILTVPVVVLVDIR